ncbi:Hypothetical predicted protein [Mytilus galloprovincialis]|uniref:Uncharacterized protein n=1 Tax=Mytilus galloprovincialis TaxID=29158 RepID=A0A8B6BT47_MYTGA|nr:Hypothetical predicted protein [Mytilus galloprovincialis]
MTRFAINTDTELNKTKPDMILAVRTLIFAPNDMQPGSYLENEAVSTVILFARVVVMKPYFAIETQCVILSL